jgi:hypothetical protein
MHIARQAVKLGNEDRAFPRAGLGERRGELRATVESIRAFAGFDLDMLGGDLEALGSGESECCASSPSPDLPCLAVLTRM